MKTNYILGFALTIVGVSCLGVIHYINRIEPTLLNILLFFFHRIFFPSWCKDNGYGRLKNGEGKK